MHLVNH